MLFSIGLIKKRDSLISLLLNWSFLLLLLHFFFYIVGELFYILDSWISVCNEYETFLCAFCFSSVSIFTSNCISYLSLLFLLSFIRFCIQSVCVFVWNSIFLPVKRQMNVRHHHKFKSFTIFNNRWASNQLFILVVFLLLLNKWRKLITINEVQGFIFENQQILSTVIQSIRSSEHLHTFIQMKMKLILCWGKISLCLCYSVNQSI